MAFQSGPDVGRVTRRIVDACREPLDYLFVHLDAITSNYASLFLGVARILFNAFDFSIDALTHRRLYNIWQTEDSVLLVVGFYAPDAGVSRSKHPKTLIVFMNPRYKSPYDAKLAECYAMLAHQVNNGDFFSTDRAKSLVAVWSRLPQIPVGATESLEKIGRQNVHWVNEHAGAVRASSKMRSNAQFRIGDARALEGLLKTIMVSGVSLEEYERCSRNLVVFTGEETGEGSMSIAGGSGSEAAADHFSPSPRFALPPFGDHRGDAKDAKVQRLKQQRDHIADCVNNLPSDTSLNDALTAVGLATMIPVLERLHVTTLDDVRFVEPEDIGLGSSSGTDSSVNDVPAPIRRKFLVFKEHAASWTDARLTDVRARTASVAKCLVSQVL